MDKDKKALLTLVTGGARSGKSVYAQKEALLLSQSPVYVATAKRYQDEEFKSRINRHISDRDERWTTIEEQVAISAFKLDKKVVVVDCITLWLTNLFSVYKYDVEQCLIAMKKEMEALLLKDASFFIITNELGMGVHAESSMGRKFTDLQGWTNQYIASHAQRVVFMVCGIPMIIKNEL